MTLGFFSKSCLAAVGFALCLANGAWAQQCSSASSQELLAAIKLAPEKSAAAYADWAPWGSRMSVAIRPLAFAQGGEVDSENVKEMVRLRYRVLVETAKGSQQFVPLISVNALPKDHPLVEKGKAAENDILLTFLLPENSAAWGWGRGNITAIACQDNQLQFFANTQTNFSSPKTTGLVSLVVALAIYIFLSQGVRMWEIRHELRKLNWYKYLDPVILTSGPNGDGSISRLQILYFSFLVFALVLNFFLKYGQLSGLSDSILVLLGISGGAAAFAKIADGQKERLSLENWAWLIEQKWLPEKGVAATKVAKWTDLVTSADGVDVYRVQMLIFSLIVGMSLTKNGLTDLTDFSIPQSMLELMGLSQVVYLGGKLVASPGYKELDNALTELRKMNPSDYAKQVPVVRKMFETVFGAIAPEAILPSPPQKSGLTADAREVDASGSRAGGATVVASAPEQAKG